MKINLYDKYGSVELTPKTKFKQGVGGTQTVIINIAKELAKRNHEVSIYAKCNQPGIYEGVSYFHHVDYKPQKEDILFGFESFPKEYSAKRIITWSNRFNAKHTLQYPDVEQIIVVSEWHKEYFEKELPQELAKKLVVIPNGVSDFFFQERKRIPHSIAYAGHPAKGGMNILPKVMSEVKKWIPDVKMDVFGGGSLWGWGEEKFEEIYKQMENAGIKYHGSVSKEELAIKLNETEIFFYPVATHHQETFGLVVLEAMAAGCVIVASNSGNIKNVARIGYVYDGDIYKRPWIENTTRLVATLLLDKKLLEKLRQHSREIAKEYSWKKSVDILINKVL